MNVVLTNGQKTRGVNRPTIRRLAGFFMANVQRLDPLTRWGEVSIVLVDHTVMRRLNQACFNKAESTDVVSFRFDPIPGDEGRTRAEIVVNIVLAAEEGEKRRHWRRPAWDEAKELALYLAHGCDHLLRGESDANPQGRARMRKRELHWVAAAARRQLL